MKSLAGCPGSQCGLFHPRCKDSTSTYFEGITNIQPMTDEEMAEMERREQLEAKESYCKNEAKKNRRIAEHSLDGENKKAYSHRAEQNERKAAEVERAIRKSTDKSSAIDSWEVENYKNSTEKGLLITSDGKKIDFGGTDHNVTGKADDIKLMNGATFTHNHPTDNTFSQNDIVTGLVKGNLKELRAVTSTGDVHILVNNGATEEQRKKFSAAYQQRRMKAANAADSKIRKGERINKDEYIKSRLEAFMSENAKDYNLTYVKSHIDYSFEDQTDLKKLSNIITGKKYKNTINAFEKNLLELKNKDVSIVLTRANKDVDYSKSHRRNSYFNMGENKIYLYKNATPSTVAHELFHKIDNDNSISVSGILDDCIRSDYERLVKKLKKLDKILKICYF